MVDNLYHRGKNSLAYLLHVKSALLLDASKYQPSVSWFLTKARNRNGPT